MIGRLPVSGQSDGVQIALACLHDIAGFVPANFICLLFCGFLEQQGLLPNGHGCWIVAMADFINVWCEMMNDETNQQSREQQEQRMRLNPRLVFTDPDEFFTDLLLEQNEQQ